MDRFLIQDLHATNAVSGEDAKRIKELEDAASTRGLNEAETAEAIRLRGGFLEGPGYTELGVTNPAQFTENFFFIMLGEAENAYRNGYFLEAISLRTLALDFMLRVFVVHKSEESIDPDTKLTLGQLIAKAEDNELPQDLVDDLRAFNKKRNDGVHNFLLGRISFQAIGDAYRGADGLFERIIFAADLPPAMS